MPLQQEPVFNKNPDSMLKIDMPASGGINLYDLEYKQEANQSPYLLNMMYRNGGLSKRYGQNIYKTFEDNIYASFMYKSDLMVHVGDKLYINDELVYSGLNEKKGLFTAFNQKVYYFCDELYVYDGKTFEIVKPYIPNVVINRHPDPTDEPGDSNEAYNMLGYGFQNTFDGDGSSVDYVLTDDKLTKIIPTVIVFGTKLKYDDTLTESDSFKVNYETGTITFKSAPAAGVNNVEIIAYKYDEEWSIWNDRIFNSKYAIAYGGNNNSRLFLAGNQESIIIYSDVDDASYFPYRNYIKIGNGAEDITGFGQQYGILCVFKPREIYALEYYINTDNTTVSESQVGIGAFSSKPINNMIGCDCPGTIQLINSQLTWLNSNHGVCTLVSTNILDERNVRTISRNIDRTNNLGIEGLLDWPNNKETVSADFDGKYFLANKTNGKCFMWDYVLSPYSNTGRIEDDAKRLSWFLFDNFYVESFQNRDNELLYLNENRIIKLNDSFNDFGQTINSVYMTPLFEYNVSAGGSSRRAVEYLKTIKNVYIQCRGEHASEIEMRYINEENPEGEIEQEPIKIPSRLWSFFTYENFNYTPLNFMNVFRRKCSIKKVQIMGIKFTNNVLNADMSISHLTLQYDNVKNVK